MEVVSLLLNVLEAWLSIGLLFGLVFVSVGAGRVDRTAVGSSWRFRLLLIPGCLLFWPTLAWTWARGRTLPMEASAHRDAARAQPEAR